MTKLNKSHAAGFSAALVLFGLIGYYRMKSEAVPATNLWEDVNITTYQDDIMGEMLFIRKGDTPLLTFSIDDTKPVNIGFGYGNSAVGSLSFREENPFYWICDSRYIYTDVDLDGIFDLRRTVQGEEKGVEYQWLNGTWSKK
jgi:hypothetical protein